MLDSTPLLSSDAKAGSPAAAGRWLVLSFHDLAPHTQRPCQELLLQTERLGIPRISLLVVPRWYGVESIEDRPFFVRWLQALAQEGHEICLHGLTHRVDELPRDPVGSWMARVYMAGEGEFYRIGKARAEEKVREGLARLAALGLPVQGFVAPSWLLSRQAREVLLRRGFAYTVSQSRLDLLRDNRRIAAPTVVFSTRSLVCRAASRAWACLRFKLSREAPILRISVHPGDLFNPALRSTLLRLIERALEDRAPVTYGELVERVLSPAPAAR